MSALGCDDDEEPCPWRRRLEQRKVKTESTTSAATEAQISTVSLDMKKKEPARDIFAPNLI
ncbi:hypothetical protein TRIUR3_20668 [Triticum urartu]|uniref:Uncharacterized protein n=1 Tax=Triticum urartu TaxID=4572 RepID=M7ZHL9_TRIUA|nr:hypothetical protein TRIUR3_20668 [Triticum urartu]